jgi:hypothetical protein
MIQRAIILLVIVLPYIPQEVIPVNALKAVLILCALAYILIKIKATKRINP